jgi:hypothetical protein
MTDTTVVRVGNKTGSLSDIETGQSANPEFQRQGNEQIAVIIIGIILAIQPKKGRQLGRPCIDCRGASVVV